MLFLVGKQFPPKLTFEAPKSDVNEVSEEF